MKSPNLDANRRGVTAAFKLINRLLTSGHEAEDPRLPPDTGTDWNDVLRAQLITSPTEVAA